jgi:ATP-dependent RNA helicase DDX27
LYITYCPHQPKRDKHSGLTRKAKRRKLVMEADKVHDKTMNAAIRSAKKASRPTKIGFLEPVKTKQKAVTKRSKGSFDRDLSNRKSVKARNSLK